VREGGRGRERREEGGEKVKLEEWRGSGGVIAPGAGEMKRLSIMEIMEYEKTGVLTTVVRLGTDSVKKNDSGV
jgi:hypothetical protein